MTAALYLVIPLVLLTLLLLRRYPGERRLLALATRRLGARRRAVAGSPARPPRPGLWSPRGGLLIACSLAVRPPPPASVAVC